MNLQQLDKLLKRVNIEENEDVKEHMLLIIEKCINDLTVKDEKDEKVEETATFSPVEMVKEDTISINMNVPIGGEKSDQVDDHLAPQVNVSLVEKTDEGQQQEVSIQNGIEEVIKHEDKDTATNVEEVVEIEESAVQEEASTAEETPYLTTKFLLHPDLIVTFGQQKEAVVQQSYAIQSAKGIARLLTKNAQGTITIGVDEKSTIPEGLYMAKMVDYNLEKVDKNTFTQIMFELNPVSENVQPAPSSENPETQTEEVQEQSTKANVEVVALRDVPSDFPLTNNLSFMIYPTAQKMFSLETAKSMIGQSITLTMYHQEDKNCVALTHDVFEMAAAQNQLTKETIRNSKWIARITNVDLKEVNGRKAIYVQFDRLEEVLTFPNEKPEDVREADQYTVISEETFFSRKEELIARQVA